jgi:hypothetical protein
MANTPNVGIRIAPELISAARGAAPELATVDVPTLARVGLLVLAGHGVRDALPLATLRRGPVAGKRAATA